MDSFKIAFWKRPVSKDDSFVDFYEAADLVHASVNRTPHSDTTRYSVELMDETLQAQYGRIVLAKSTDGRWKVVSALNSIEDIFFQLISAIENAEMSIA